MGDLKCILERIVALRQSMVDDGILNGIPFHENDILTLTERSRSEGSSFVKVTLPKLGKALDYGLISGTFHSIADFSLRKGTNLPRFAYSCFARIFDDSGALRSDPCVSTIYFLRQFLSLDGKLEKAYTSEQEKAAVDGFRSRQLRLGKTRLKTDHPVLYRAQRLITRMMKRCDLSSITPGHGPGGVAEGYDRFTRWDFRAWPSRAERWYPFNVYGSQSFEALCQQGAPVMEKISVTKCSLVPKDFKGPRLISSESTATQYLQQGQMKLLMQYVDNHRILSKSIRFRDQTRNQTACRDAYEQGMVTLDLSNASDTVSAALVWYLFAGVPVLRSQLFCTRSQYMDVKGERIRITAFSPMGSAVCFPVETLVFWALSLASVRFVQHHWGDGSKDPTLPSESEMASAVAVFGDDIIVPDYALAVLIGTLTEVGCEVNTSKTCYLTPFRESCGAEYFNHTDVAIIRNRRYDYDDRNKFINLPGLLDLQRKLFLCGLYNSAALLRTWAQEIVPIVTQKPPCITAWYDAHFRSIRFSVRRVKSRGLDPLRRRYDKWLHTDTSDQDPFGDCLTAVPSGLGRVSREAGSFDRLCCAFGLDNSLDRGMRVRYNKNLQRYECRVPGLFQLTRSWPLQVPPVTNGSCKAQGIVVTNRFIPKRVRAPSLNTGYPRLLSRVIGDSVERITIRDVMSKMVWSEIPFYFASQHIIR